MSALTASVWTETLVRIRDHHDDADARYMATMLLDLLVAGENEPAIGQVFDDYGMGLLGGDDR